MKPKLKRLLMFSPLILAGFALFVFVGGEVVMHLWNWLLPSLVGVRAIGFWEALGLLALCRILFGGSGFHGHARSRMGHRMRERCERMSPEDRERFREEMRARWASRDESGPQG